MTKKIELWTDLYPGWQDNKDYMVFACQTPSNMLHGETRRVKITVDLPCFGGSADMTDAVQSKSELDMPETGFKP